MTGLSDFFAVPLSFSVSVDWQEDEGIFHPGLGHRGVYVGKVEAVGSAPDGKVMALTLEGPLKGGYELRDATFGEAYLADALNSAREWKTDPTDEQARFVASRLSRWAIHL